MGQLSDILLGFGTGALEEAATQRAERRKAQVEAQAKLSIDPEAIAKFRLLNLARQAGLVPQPEGGYNIGERRAGIPEAVSGAAKERELNILRHLLPRSSTGVNVFAFDPSTGTVTPASGGSALPSGSRVLPTHMSPEEIAVASEQRARGIAAGQRETPERIQAATAVDSMLDSLDQMEQFLLKDRFRLATSKIPFVEREFAAIVAQFDKEAAIAAGGKQLTQTELTLIRKTRPTIQDIFDPKAIQRKITKLRQIGKYAQQRLARAPSFLSERTPTRSDAKHMRDAQGNEAIIYPDGRVEELQ